MDAMEYCAYVYDTGLVILDNLQARHATPSLYK